MDENSKPVITVTIKGNTEDLNAKLDDSVEKAKELINLLQQINIAPSPNQL